MLIGCSSSNQTVDDSTVTELPADEISPADSTENDPESIPQPKTQPKRQTTLPSPSQRFSVQADTVDVLRKKKQGSPATSISVKASTPKKFYTVEVGAFRLQSNVNRHQEQLAKRFKLPVRVLFDSSIGLTRVCVGTFSQKSAAIEFMKNMRVQFPKEYSDCWVSYWTK